MLLDKFWKFGEFSLVKCVSLMFVVVGVDCYVYKCRVYFGVCILKFGDDFIGVWV